MANHKRRKVLKKEFEKQIKGKKIILHKDFNKGWRYAICLKCGYPITFMGALKYKGTYTLDCLCNKTKFKEFKTIERFILKLQEIAIKCQTKKK